MNNKTKNITTKKLDADALLTRVNERFGFEPNGPIPECLIVEGKTGGYYKATPKDVYDFVKVELAPTYSEKEMCEESAIAENREEILDMMAQSVANYFGADIGEHSNLNDPWKNAIDIIKAAHEITVYVALLEEECELQGINLDYMKRSAKRALETDAKQISRSAPKIRTNRNVSGIIVANNYDRACRATTVIIECEGQVSLGVDEEVAVVEKKALDAAFGGL